MIEFNLPKIKLQLNFLIELSLVISLCWQQNKFSYQYFQMNGTGPLEFFKRFKIHPKLSYNSLANYIFIFSQGKIIANSLNSIKEIFCKQVGVFPPVGYSYEDYEFIQDSIKRQFNQKLKYTSSESTIFLVGDLQSVSAILSEKRKNNSLQNIKQVLMCHNPNEQKQAEQLRKNYEIINKENYKIETVLKAAEKSFKIAKDNNQVFKNYICLGKEYYEQSSYIMKVRFEGCINIEEKDYEKYRIKFAEYLNKELIISTFLDKQITFQLELAQKYLKQQKMDKFSQKMLFLYQSESLFYKIINKGLLNFTQQSFEWQSIVLPICFLFKVIKYQFEKQKGSKQVAELFKKGQLWRVGKKNDAQLKVMKQIAPQQPYYELKSFISTSIDKILALEKFLDPNKPEQNCIIKFILKKPIQLDQMLQFPFIYLSFVIMPKKKINGQNVNQQEVLLNALLVGKLVSVTEISYKQIQNMSSTLKKRFQPHGLKSVPVIQIEIGTFQNDLMSYSKEKKMEQNKRYALKNYQTILDMMKRVKIFDIGYSLKASGNLEAAYKYNKRKIMQLQQEISEKRQIIQTQKQQQQQLIQQQPQLQRNQQLQRYKQLHNRYFKLSETCCQLNLEQQAVQFIQNSIKTYKLVEQIDTNRTFREHQQYFNIMYQKSSFMLKGFKRFHEAAQIILQGIKELNLKADKQPDMKQVCEFQIAERQILLGILYFKEGRFTQAQDYLKKSQKRMNKVYQDIGYEDLKNQTFYFGFFFYLLQNVGSKNIYSEKQYFDDQRAKKISQATYIFGGRAKFDAVKANSQSLIFQMQEFMNDNEDKIVEKNGKWVFRQTLPSTDPSEQELEVVIIPIEEKMQECFKNHRLVNQLKPKCNEFFSQFTNCIIEYEQSTKTHVAQKYKQLINLILQIMKDRNVSSTQQKEKRIEELKVEVVDEMLEEWQKCNPNVQYDQSTLEIKMKIDALIIDAKQKQARILSRQNNINRKLLQEYSRSVAASIQNYIRQKEKWGYLNPNETTIGHYFELYNCFENSWDVSQQENTIIKIINLIDNRYDLIQKMLQSYLLSIKLHYKIADYDFINSLSGLSILITKEIKDIQIQQISQCKDNFKEAYAAIEKYQKKLNEKENFSHVRKKSSFIKKKKKRLIPLQNQIVINNNLEKHEDKVQFYKIQLKLWELKINLINSKLPQRQQMEKFNQRVFSNELVTVKGLIDSLDQFQRPIYTCFYEQLCGFFDYVGNQTKKIRSQTSQANIIKSITKMKVALASAKGLPERRRQLQILIKTYFMFIKENYSHIQDLDDEISLYNKDKSHPQFWKICLIQYLIVEQQQKHFYMAQCLSFLDQIKYKNKHFFKKFEVINEWWTSQSKKYRSPLKRSSSISKSKIYNQIPNIFEAQINQSYLKMKLQNNRASNASTIFKTCKKQSFQQPQKLHIKSKEKDKIGQLPMQESMPYEQNSLLDLNINRQNKPIIPNTIIQKSNSSTLEGSHPLSDLFKHQSETVQFNPFDTQPKFTSFEIAEEKQKGNKLEKESENQDSLNQLPDHLQTNSVHQKSQKSLKQSEKQKNCGQEYQQNKNKLGLSIKQLKKSQSNKSFRSRVQKSNPNISLVDIEGDSSIANLPTLMQKKQIQPSQYLARGHRKSNTMANMLPIQNIAIENPENRFQYYFKKEINDKLSNQHKCSKEKSQSFKVQQK